LPTALTRSDPEVAVSRYRRSPRERRRRAALALRGIASNARRSVFLPLTVIFVALGVLFFMLPREMAFVFGVICAWLALSAGREAFRRRADR
jgi:predicted membrane metal-binding protein